MNGFKESVDGQSTRIFAVGTALEPVIVEWLRGDGWKVDYNPGSQNAELEFTIPVRGGKLTGHPDYFLSKPGAENIPADIKTMNERAFVRWKREGTEKEKPQYMDQVHVYAMAAMNAGFPVERPGIVGVNKNNSAMHIDLFDFEPERMSAIIERTERIFSAAEAPEPGDRMEKWCCNYCGYSGMCGLAEKESRDTHVDDGIMLTNVPDVIDAMELLKEARELGRAGEELEKDAKEVLDREIRQKGIRTVRGGSLILTLNEVLSSRFDSKAFKKDHPDMAVSYTKPGSFLRYDIKEAV